MARLVEVERRLESLHSALDITGDSTPIGVIALAFGHRARSLYLGVRHAVEGPSEATAQAALRVLVEQTILLPWPEGGGLLSRGRELTTSVGRFVVPGAIDDPTKMLDQQGRLMAVGSQAANALTASGT